MTISSFSQTSFSMTQWSFRSTVFNSCRQNPLGAQQALSQLALLFQADALLRGGFSGHGRSLESQQGLVPGRPCLPQPGIEHSGAPAGKGLEKNPAGWPEGSVSTAGGYTIVPEGKQAAWSIYAPGQKHGEKPNTRVWGDPHVDEKDGTRWDFTKNSDFVLPDGTRINCQTTSETGYSVSKGLTIANGADKVQIDGIDKNRPTTGNITNDGYEWRAKHLAANPGRDSFHLGGSGDNVKWFKETAGVNHGEITGAHMDKKSNRYEQITNGDKQYWVSPNLRPPVGSEAWGNQMRSELADIYGKSGIPPEAAQLAGAYLGVDHAASQIDRQLQQLFGGLFGGLGGHFGGWGNAYGAVQGLGDQMLLQAELALALGFGRYGGILA
jgi:hypothetical protein